MPLLRRRKVIKKVVYPLIMFPHWTQGTVEIALKVFHERLTGFGNEDGARLVSDAYREIFEKEIHGRQRKERQED